jgi:PAS domain S-box-containing protein
MGGTPDAEDQADRLQRLEREARRAKAILYSIGDGVIATDADARVTMMNRSAELLTGWNEAEALGRPATEVLHIVNEDTGVEVPSPVDRVLREGVVVGLANHTLLIRKDGTRSPIADSGAPVHDQTGAIDGAVLVFRDQSLEKAYEQSLLREISERKRHALALEQSEAQYRLLFSANPCPMFIFDEGTLGILAVNRAALRTYGWSEDEFLALSVLDVRPPEDRALARQVIERNRGKLDTHIGLFRHCRKDRTVLEMEVTISALEFAGCSARLCSMNDVTERRRTEEILRRHDLVVTESRDALLFVRASDGRILDANPAAVALYGYRHHELLELTLREIRAPQARATLAQQLSRATTAGMLFETVHQRKDGSTFPVEVSTRGIAVGNDHMLISVVRDIGDRHHARAQLEHLNAVLRGIRNVNQLIVQEKDPQRLIQRACETLVETRGYQGAWIVLSEREGSAVPVWAGKWVHTEARSIFESALRTDPKGWPSCRCKAESAADGLVVVDTQTVCQECPLWKSRAHQAAVVVALRREGETLGFLGVSFENGVEVDAEERGLLLEVAGDLAFALGNIDLGRALQTREEQYRRLFENMLNAVAYGRMLYEDGKPSDFVYLMVNDAFVRQTGLRDVVGRRATQVIPGLREKDPEVFELYGRVATTGTPVRMERHLKALDMWFWVSVFSPEPMYFVAVFDVITERKRAEEERERLQVQLASAQKMESVGRLAGGIAHDFNNMLGVINGHAELLLEKVPEGDPLRASVREIFNAGSRSASLTRQLLAFARRQPRQLQVVDLNEVVVGILSMLRRLIGENIELAWSPGADLWTVNMDPTQIDQVLTNLVANARDAITGVGTALLSTGNVTFDEKSLPNVPGAAPGDYVRLSMADTGSGMDEGTMAHVFEPFFTTKGVGQGTGLGLATVYGVVQQNNGFICVTSAVGKGTTFDLYFPRRAGQPKPTSEPTAAHAHRHGNETILVVEDEEQLIELVARILGRLGYHVLTATTPGRALELARSHPGTIDLVLADLVMPQMTGLALAGLLLEHRPDLKCLYMSGYPAQAMATQAAAQIRIIQKPFSLSMLEKAVREVLDGDGLAPRSSSDV